MYTFAAISDVSTWKCIFCFLCSLWLILVNRLWSLHCRLMKAMSPSHCVNHHGYEEAEDNFRIWKKWLERVEWKQWTFFQVRRIQSFLWERDSCQAKAGVTNPNVHMHLSVRESCQDLAAGTVGWGRTDLQGTSAQTQANGEIWEMPRCQSRLLKAKLTQ